MLNNKVFLVSKVLAYTTDTMVRYNRVHANYDTAKAHFDTLVNDYKIDTMEYNECKLEELSEYLEVSHDTTDLWCAIDNYGETEIEIQLEELEVY